MLQIRKMEFNMLPVNCYILWDESREAVIIDAGCIYDREKKALKDFIDEQQLTIAHLLNTHLHFDHIFGNPFLWNTFRVGAEAHSADLPWLNNVQQMAKKCGIMVECDAPVPLKGYLNEGDRITFGQHELEVFHIPGHSAGSLCFYCASEGVLFTGDALFAGSIGRTDLGGGTEQQLVEGIRTKLLTLPGATVVYPGHGPATTLEREKARNPYLL